MSDQNPYANRDHENGGPADKTDVLAVASLLGQVTGSLKEIDNRNVGSQNEFTKAVKMDPKQVLTGFVKPGSTPGKPPPTANISPEGNTPPIVTETTTPPPVSIPQPVSIPVSQLTELENRINDLEKIVQTYKRVLKFKRGVSYNVSTTNIKGVYKSPEDILDLVASELAKQTKTITLKLNDTNKN